MEGGVQSGEWRGDWFKTTTKLPHTNCGEFAESGEFRVAAMQMSRCSDSSGWQADGSVVVSLM